MKRSNPFNTSMHMNVNMMGNGPFNTYPHSMFQSLSNTELLSEVRSLMAYGGLTPPASMLLGELVDRSERTLGNRPQPTEEMYKGDTYYGSQVHGDEIAHFFIVGQENVKKVEEIDQEFLGSNLDDNDYKVRLQKLLDLGRVLRVVVTDIKGNIASDVGASFISYLFAKPKFPENSLPQHLRLPILIIEDIRGMPYSEEPLEDFVRFISSYTSNNLFPVNHGKLVEYLEEGGVFREAGLKQVTKPWPIIQVQVFHEEAEIPVKLVAQGEPGFIERKGFPFTFVPTVSQDGNIFADLNTPSYDYGPAWG